MNDKYEFLQWLEEVLAERFNPKSVAKDDIPQMWKQYPLSWLTYGERNVCVRETSPIWSDNDTMSDIINLFDAYYSVLVEKVKRTTDINAQNNERSISVYIQPDYSDTSTVLIIQRNLNNLVYIKDTKPWHMTFETPEQMEVELKSEFESILANIK
jgi:hypothetical protein